jgi:hypothetical protein
VGVSKTSARVGESSWKSEKLPERMVASRRPQIRAQTVCICDDFVVTLDCS